MSELRKKIIETLEYHVGFNDERNTHLEAIDELLDAVIQALPKQIELSDTDGNYRKAYQSFNEAISQTIDILEAAKTPTTNNGGSK